MKKKSTLKQKAVSGRTLSLYLKEISNNPLISKEEERELGQRARHGDQDAIEKLVISNLRFVIKVAKKYLRPGINLQDLINEGNLGLIEAARRFDPNRNVRFISYAVWWIRQSILRYLLESRFALRIPPGGANILRKVSIILSRQNSITTERISRKALAQELSVPLSRLNNVLNAASIPLTFDKQTDENSDRALEDTLEQTLFPTAEKEIDTLSMRKQLGKSLNVLTEFERSVLSLRFGLNGDDPLTLKEIGVRLNRSRERIRQIETTALRKLRTSDKMRSLALYTG